MVSDRDRLLVNLRWGALVIGAVLIVGLAITFIRGGMDPAELAALGYPGVTLLMFISSGSIFLPAPGFAAVLAAGTVWNPLLVGICAGVGAATGELSGYLLGVGGGAVLDLKEGKGWSRAHRWLRRYGFWAILVVASIPNPVFDVLGVVAGSLGYPAKRFWVACLIGNTVKYVALAYLSSSVVGWWLLR